MKQSCIELMASSFKTWVQSGEDWEQENVIYSSCWKDSGFLVSQANEWTGILVLK